MMLDFGEAVRRFYKNYNNPEGRSQRSAYWWYLLYETILTGVFLTIFFYGGWQQRIIRIYGRAR